MPNVYTFKDFEGSSHRILLDLIQRLDVIRIDFVQPQSVEAASAHIGVVAGIQELAAAIFFGRNDACRNRLLLENVS